MKKNIFSISGKLAIFMIALFMLFGNAGFSSLYADEVGTLINQDYEGENVQSTTVIQPDVETNLLVNAENDSLVQTQHGNKLYDLDSVTINRHRQKIKVEYYVGNYETSQFLGTDEGYADYDDYIGEYLMKATELNAKFSGSIPTNYRLVPYELGTYFSYVPAYNGSDEPIVIKVLVAEVKRYNVSVSKYQNRQDVQNPNPIGQTKASIDTLTQYWRVNTLSTSFNAIVGQTVNLKNVSQPADTLTQGGRVGTLSAHGLYDPTSMELVSTDSLYVNSSLPTSLSMGVFYEVADYGSPVVNPGSSSSMTSGAGIGFIGNIVTWKSPVVSENLSLQNEVDAQKLSAYPFNLADDPFNEPEHELWYPPTNWALGHKLSIDYNYVFNSDITPVTPEPEDKETPKPGVDKKEEMISAQEVVAKKSTVNTGDSNNIFPLLSLLALSSAAGIIVIYQKLKLSNK